jgi:hypothetical protein
VNDAEPELTPRHLLYALVGAALLLVMGVFVIASGLIVPPWGTAVLVGVWLGAVIMALRSWRRKMFAPVKWGVLVGVFWIAFVAFGDAVLGWTA